MPVRPGLCGEAKRARDDRRALLGVGGPVEYGVGPGQAGVQPSGPVGSVRSAVPVRPCVVVVVRPDGSVGLHRPAGRVHARLQRPWHIVPGEEHERAGDHGGNHRHIVAPVLPVGPVRAGPVRRARLATVDGRYRHHPGRRRLDYARDHREGQSTIARCNHERIAVLCMHSHDTQQAGDDRGRDSERWSDGARRRVPRPFPFAATIRYPLRRVLLVELLHFLVGWALEQTLHGGTECTAGRDGLRRVRLQRLAGLLRNDAKRLVDVAANLSVHGRCHESVNLIFRDAVDVPANVVLDDVRPRYDLGRIIGGHHLLVLLVDAPRNRDLRHGVVDSDLAETLVDRVAVAPQVRHEQPADDPLVRHRFRHVLGDGVHAHGRDPTGLVAGDLFDRGLQPVDEPIQTARSVREPSLVQRLPGLIHVRRSSHRLPRRRRFLLAVAYTPHQHC